MLYLQHVVGGALEMLGDLVAVRGAEQERPEDQHVERALNQFHPVLRFASHNDGRYPIQNSDRRVDVLPGVWLGSDGASYRRPHFPWVRTSSVLLRSLSFGTCSTSAGRSLCVRNPASRIFRFRAAAHVRSQGRRAIDDFLNAKQFPPGTSIETATSTTNPYILGPTVELRLPANFSVQFDALFRHVRYQWALNLIGNHSQTTATSNAWEFPILLKYKLPGRFLRPYIAGGVAWDRVQGLSATISSTSHPAEVRPVLLR